MKIRQISRNLLHLTEDKALEAGELVTCSECGLTFHPTNDDQEAIADFQRDFPGQDPKRIAVVCELCFLKHR
jgi:hypothetical protein